MSRLDDFDTYIQNAMQSWHCPGVALSIIKEDDVIYERTFGLRDVEAGLELTPDTRFPVASITKSFTAMSVALLVDEGKLERETETSPYLFVTERGGPVSTTGFRKTFARIGQASTIGFPIHPHMLRHACGFKLANDGHDTRAIQHYLGHKNIQHTVSIPS